MQHYVSIGFRFSDEFLRKEWMPVVVERFLQTHTITRAFGAVPQAMMTSSNGNIFRVTGPLNSPVTGEFPSQRPMTRSFDVLFDLRLNKRLTKQSWGWWCETPSRSLWRYCNDTFYAEGWEHTACVWLVWCCTLGLSLHKVSVIWYHSKPQKLYMSHRMSHWCNVCR